MGKIKKQTYTLEMYLRKLKDLDIRTDQDVQRLSDAWNNNMVNELIVSVLNGEYIPPVILGQEKNSQMWVIDGLQRSTSLMKFRYGKYKITSGIEEPVIRYRAKVKDLDGEIRMDGNGDVLWETRTFDLKNKSFERLPEELQKIFNEFQIETVIHEDYDMKQISRLVRRFNNHRAMNVSQKAFTFCDIYARRIREILKRKFFIECTGYTANERKNGTMERMVMETIMCMFHLNNWKKSNQIGAYINENASMEEFGILENNIARLENVVSDGVFSVFTAKDSFLWFTLFYRFTKLNLNDGKFGDFLHAFKNGLCGREIDGKVFYEKGRSLKDRPVIVEKLDLLETLMREYLDIPAMESETKSELESDTSSILEFVRENAAPYATNEDVDLYKEVLDTLSRKLDASSVLLEEANKPSLMALTAYSFVNDIDLDDWFVNFAARNDTYIIDQKKNYIHMKEDLKEFMGHAHAA